MKPHKLRILRETVKAHVEAKKIFTPMTIGTDLQKLGIHLDTKDIHDHIESMLHSGEMPGYISRLPQIAIGMRPHERPMYQPKGAFVDMLRAGPKPPSDDVNKLMDNIRKMDILHSKLPADLQDEPAKAEEPEKTPMEKLAESEKDIEGAQSLGGYEVPNQHRRPLEVMAVPPTVVDARNDVVYSVDGYNRIILSPSVLKPLGALSPDRRVFLVPERKRLTLCMEKPYITALNLLPTQDGSVRFPMHVLIGSGLDPYGLVFDTSSDAIHITNQAQR